MLPLNAQVGGSSAETGLRKTGGGQVRQLSREDNSLGEKWGITLPQSQALGLHRRPDGQRIEDVEWVPEFSLLFWLVEA